jgi:hypothetical protein
MEENCPDIVSEIFNFCKIRNQGSARKNTNEPTPRVKFLIQLLERIGIPYELDRFEYGWIHFYNIIMMGSSGKMVIAHHDIVNPNSDNANDNSASVINAIALKKLSPETHVVITDGEEVGLIGSSRLADQIISGKFGDIDWVLNIELSGRGGKNFMIGSFTGKLSDTICEKFNPPVYGTPPNDCMPIHSAGIDTNVITPLPLLIEGESCVTNGEIYLDNSLWYLCHTDMDTLDRISVEDMRDFVNEVLLKIVEN